MLELLSNYEIGMDLGEADFCHIDRAFDSESIILRVASIVDFIYKISDCRFIQSEINRFDIC